VGAGVGGFGGALLGPDTEFGILWPAIEKYICVYIYKYINRTIRLAKKPG